MKFVSVVLCWDPIPGKKMHYMIWKNRKSPFYWTIPKIPLVDNCERETAIRMLKNIYMIDTDIVTPPMDRYVQPSKKNFREDEVNFFLVKILDMDAGIHIPMQCTAFSMTNPEVAITNLQEVDRNAVRYYDSYVVPKMFEALSLIEEEQLRKAFTNAVKEKKKKENGDVFKDTILSISCLMSGSSLTGVITSPRYHHPLSSETWHGAIKKLSKLGISYETEESY